MAGKILIKQTRFQQQSELISVPYTMVDPPCSLSASIWKKIKSLSQLIRVGFRKQEIQAEELILPNIPFTLV